MSLTAQSLASAYYARDQITASYIAQEAIEAIRSVRDGNILLNSQGTQTDLLAGLPSTTGSPFTIDTRDNTMNLCSTGTCPALSTDGTFYAYGPVHTTDIYSAHDGWITTQFTRTITAVFVGSGIDEVKITVTVSWKSGAFQARSFTISENLYRWVKDLTNGSSGSSGGSSAPALSCSSPVGKIFSWIPVTAANGTSPYTWSAPGSFASFRSGAGNNVDNIMYFSGGTKTVTVTDAANATANCSVSVAG
jgi:hypothetical protein